MKQFIATLALAALVSAPGFAQSSSTGTSAQSAMPTCKGNIVWAWSKYDIYVRKGEPHYGKMGGMYMCEAAAAAKGYHHATAADEQAVHKKLGVKVSPAPAASP